MSRSGGAAAGLAIAAGLGLAAAAYYYLSSRRRSEGEDSVEADTERILQLPVIDFGAFNAREGDPARYAAECKKVAEALHKYGVCVVRDPRVHESDNNRFLDMMERYFELSDGIRDARPEYAYQVGVTPEFTERPRNHCARVGSMGPNDKPLSVCPPELDPKWRFFWRIGPVPPKTDFPALNADAVIPPELPEWTEVMDMWGNKMLAALFVLAEMAAVGFDMPADSFTARMQYGPHLLAPTGSDFHKFGQEGTVLAGYHYDLNFLTIHGKSRFPGLNAWTRDGRKMGVAIPDGCLLVQAGRQIEYLTGGHVLAGYHEVLVTKQTAKVIENKTRLGQSLWRVSSTLFGHIQSDQILRPLPPFDKLGSASAAAFPPIAAGQQVTEELLAINLDQSQSQSPSQSPDRAGAKGKGKGK